MKISLCLSIFLTPFLYGKDLIFSKDIKKLMEQTKEEALDFASLRRDAILDEMVKGDPQKGFLSFAPDDFIPDEDKGKNFDPGIAATKQDMKLFIDAATKRERVEGTEEFLSNSLRAVEDPQAQIDMLRGETKHNVSDERFEVCQEAGTYQVPLIQKRVVEVMPPVIQEVRRCKGHKENKGFYWKNDAKEYRDKKEKELSKDGTIGSHEVKIDGRGMLHDYEVVYTYTHKENIACKRSHIEQKIVQESTERDSWEADAPEALSALSANPNCRILYSQLVVGPETRSINGSTVFRDSWAQQLFFSCGDEANSKCAKLRELGGKIYSKKCLKKALFNESECDLWEKTYKISKEVVSNETKTSFRGEGIWGLQDFDSAYESNGDLGPIATTLAVFADIKEDAEKGNTDFANGKAEVFKGTKLGCQRSFVEGVLFDCCKKMDGVAVTSNLCRCTSEEQELAQKREEGKCRYIGTYTKNLGTQRVQSFCCFPTKLARVIHEQGREQLRIDWGSAEKPNCSGLSVDQLRSLDFTKIELSEVLDDLKVDKQLIQRKIQDVANDLKTEESKLRMKQQSEGIIQKEKEKQEAIHG